MRFSWSVVVNEAFHEAETSFIDLTNPRCSTTPSVDGLYRDGTDEVRHADVTRIIADAE